MNWSPLGLWVFRYLLVLSNSLFLQKYSNPCRSTSIQILLIFAFFYVIYSTPCCRGPGISGSLRQSTTHCAGSDHILTLLQKEFGKYFFEGVALLFGFPMALQSPQSEVVWDGYARNTKHYDNLHGSGFICAILLLTLLFSPLFILSRLHTWENSYIFSETKQDQNLEILKIIYKNSTSIRKKLNKWKFENKNWNESMFTKTEIFESEPMEIKCSYRIPSLGIIQEGSSCSMHWSYQL